MNKPKKKLTPEQIRKAKQSPVTREGERLKKPFVAVKHAGKVVASRNKDEIPEEQD